MTKKLKLRKVFKPLYKDAFKLLEYLPPDWKGERLEITPEQRKLWTDKKNTECSD